MSEATVEVVIRDLVNGGEEIKRLAPGEYLVTTAMPLEVAHERRYPRTGTVVLTLRRWDLYP